MKNDRRLVFVRIVLWYGIIADFVCTVQYCIPQTMLNAFGMTETVTPFSLFILIQSAALMAAWTLLLVWTDRKPVERRMVMLLTVPVALGICISYLYLITMGAISKIWIFFLAAPLTTAGLFLAAYIAACRIHRTGMDSDRTTPPTKKEQ